MIQEILTHIIVLAAVAYALFNTVKLFMPVPKKNGVQHHCTGCSGCDMKNMQQTNIYKSKSTLPANLKPN
jgi:hypothetical protein